MEKKILFIIFSIVLISISPQVFADEDLDALLQQENGVLIEQQKIIFEIGKHSDIHVKHVIDTGAWSENRPRIIEILPGMQSNLTVTDEDGDKYSFSYDKETFEKSKYIILKQKLGNYDLIAEYDLNDFMKLKNGKWMSKLEYNSDLQIMFEDDIDLIFVNSRPVNMNDAKGINCVGCNLVLEFFENDEIIQKDVLVGGEKYEIDVLTDGEISEWNFVGGGSQILSFNVENEEQLVVLKIPFKLFLNPYDVYLTEKDDKLLDQIDKIRKTEFSQDETHVKLLFRTNSEGTISIVGATPEEHQKTINRIEKTKSQEQENPIPEERERGVVVPIPGRTPVQENISEFSRDGVLIEESELSFADNLDRNTDQSVFEPTTVIIIVGIISAIIVGFVIKLKKS